MRLETEQIVYRDGGGTLTGFLVIDAERAGKGPGVLVPPARVVVDSGAAVHLETEQIVYRDGDAGADYQRERHAWLHA